MYHVTCRMAERLEVVGKIFLRHYGFVQFVLKPGFHKSNFHHDNDQFWIKTKRLVGIRGMTAEPNNRFDFCVVVVAFAVNGNQA